MQIEPFVVMGGNKIPMSDSCKYSTKKQVSNTCSHSELAILYFYAQTSCHRRSFLNFVLNVISYMCTFYFAEPVYVPFLVVGSIFIAFIIVGSLVAVYCCTCLRPKQTSQQPMRFTLRSYPPETLPMILTGTNLRTPSRQSSTATSSTSTGGSVRRLSSSRAEPGYLVTSPPPPYSSAHSIHLNPSSTFLVSTQYFSYPLQADGNANKNCPDFRQ